ncbi:MAG: hypothetical protein AAF467_12265 [Actinomycetota bacterium]
MFIRLDFATGALTLEQPDDCTAFHVEAVGASAPTTTSVADGLGLVGRVADDEHVWVEMASVRQMASGQVEPGWPDDFDAMVDFARSNGWVDESGSALRAHIVWSGAPI